MITWRSKKQNVIAQSSVEAEFQAMAHDIKKFLDDLKIKYKGPMKLCFVTTRTKYIEIDRESIKEKLDNDLIITTLC